MRAKDKIESVNSKIKHLAVQNSAQVEQIRSLGNQKREQQAHVGRMGQTVKDLNTRLSTHQELAR